jgi:four helix bundle protein
MDSLKQGRRLRAFRAADAFAVEAYRVSVALPAAGARGLIDSIRQIALRSGSALAAAAASSPGAAEERRLVEQARNGLLEGRYYLYLARRLGLLDTKRYRGLTLRHDAAMREIDALLHRRRPP